MKKFKFSLDTVLSYKYQVLDALRIEHAAILGEVHAQEELLAALRQEYHDYSEEYRERTETGLSITDAMRYQAGLRALEREIEQEIKVLEQLRKKEEAKRLQMVEAKKETSSIEKLKEKKLNAYQKDVAKSEEQFIEEFVSSLRATSAGA